MICLTLCVPLSATHRNPAHKIPLDIFYQTLRLFPRLMPAILRQNSPANCTVHGLFIGKLIVHNERVIGRSAFEAVKRTMIAYPTERAQLVEAFLFLIQDDGTAACAVLLL
jgi:hypothetical protein